MLEVIKKKQNNCLYVVTRKCATALHRKSSVIPVCFPNFAFLITKITKHCLNQNQYPQPQWCEKKRYRTSCLWALTSLSSKPVLPFTVLNSPSTSAEDKDEKA